ncbi:hypothetical protein OPT61_g3065 [Boeremia exigua]|uniref:Uncharacterized protein n=1 Tax=Boeremia exigua TaxID=749465 RepID=A0ACC2IJ95_9PLEO|nr:hypothetical protein OPT61_g3065 [Boeremia exigua]
MARTRCSLYFLILLAFQSVLIPCIEAQSNETFLEQPEYTTFELFKNSGLRPCPVNYTSSTKNALVPREPRRGGGGGGGTRGGGATNPLFASTWVSKQKPEDYCKYMTGTPIMIPTLPTQNSFTPWWPAFTMQFLSFLFTWVGLWWTTRGIERNPEAHDMSLPITFWMQLPIDICRMVAWFVRTIQGLADTEQFSWVSVIAWLVPFNYIWLTRLIVSKVKDDTSNTQPGTVETIQVQQFEEQGQPLYANYRDLGPQNKQMDPRAISVNNPIERRSKLHWISMTFLILTIAQWCLSLSVVALHFRYSWLDKDNHPTYLEAPRAISDPSSVADMPQSCLAWLQQSSSLIASELLDMHLVQVLFCLINAFQFIVCTVVVLVSSRGRYRVLGKLKISAWASLLSLGLPALGTGIWIIAKVVFGDQDTWITYTQNLNTTGGCTFAAVTMDRQWGYWDVQYGLPLRIGMSALGVA